MAKDGLNKDGSNDDDPMETIGAVVLTAAILAGAVVYHWIHKHKGVNHVPPAPARNDAVRNPP